MLLELPGGVNYAVMQPVNTSGVPGKISDAALHEIRNETRVTSLLISTVAFSKCIGRNYKNEQYKCRSIYPRFCSLDNAFGTDIFDQNTDLCKLLKTRSIWK